MFAWFYSIFAIDEHQNEWHILGNGKSTAEARKVAAEKLKETRAQLQQLEVKSVKVQETVYKEAQ